MRIVIGLVVRDSFPGLKKNCLTIAAELGNSALDAHLGSNSKIWKKLSGYVRNEAKSREITIEEAASSYTSTHDLEELTEDILKDFLKYFGGYYLNSDQGGFGFNPDDFNDSYEETFITFLKLRVYTQEYWTGMSG